MRDGYAETAAAMVVGYVILLCTLWILVHLSIL